MSSSLPGGEVGRITDSLVGVGAVLSSAGLLAGGGALPPGHLLAPLLHHCLVLGRTLTIRIKNRKCNTNRVGEWQKPLLN